VTLPAQSLQDASEPDDVEPPDGGRVATANPARELPFPLAFFSVIGVSALVIILCVIGATVAGGFDFLRSDDATPQVSATSDFTAPTAGAPANQFADGMWLVPADVTPGTYKATVPADSPGCSWERRSSTSGTTDAVLESGTGTRGEVQVVIIQATDKVFQAQGCGIWRRTSD
jgi:hypothetical protein